MLAAREVLQGITQSLSELGQELKADKVLEQLKRTAEQLNNSKPRLIVYGKYNSGKSTLINALVSQRGEEVAPVADHPKTAESTIFHYRDAELLDTPGILAPKDHEQIAKETLLSAELVLFVVSTQGAFDEQKVVAELHQIIDSDLPILIIINDKDGYLSDKNHESIHPNLELILQKARTNVGTRGRNGQVRYLAVNAKSGFKAKQYVETKQKAYDSFWQKSGLASLEEALEYSLNSFSEADRLRPHYRVLQEFCASLKTTAENKLSNSNMQSISQEITSRQNSIQACQQDGIRRIAKHRQTLTQLLQGLIAKNEKLTESSLAPYLNAVQGELQSTLDQHLPHIYSTVELNAAQVSQVLAQPNMEEHGLSEVSSGIDEQILNLLGNGAGEHILKEVMSQLPKTLAPVLSASGQKALSGLLGTVSRGLGPMLLVGSLYLQYRNAKKREEEMERRAIDQQRQKIEACREGAQALENKMVEQWQEIVKSTTKLATSALNEDLKQIGAEDTQVSQLIKQLSEVQERFQQINLQ